MGMRDLSRTPDVPAWDLLDRYYAGEATDLEQDRLDAYFAAHPDRRSVLDALAHVIRRQAGPAMATSVRSMLSAAHQRIAQSLGVRPAIRRAEYGRFEYAVAALLDVEDTGLTPEQMDELRRMIDSAREEGR
jgi:hypothetical protein